jgi:hypothetical protein
MPANPRRCREVGEQRAPERADGGPTEGCCSRCVKSFLGWAEDEEEARHLVQTELQLPDGRASTCTRRPWPGWIGRPRPGPSACPCASRGGGTARPGRCRSWPQPLPPLTGRLSGRDGPCRDQPRGSWRRTGWCGARSSPTTQVPGGGELGHVQAPLGDDRLGAPDPNPGDFVQPLHRWQRGLVGLVGTGAGRRRAASSARCPPPPLARCPPGRAGRPAPGRASGRGDHIRSLAAVQGCSGEDWARPRVTAADRIRSTYPG